jgi:hypothetical protein
MDAVMSFRFLRWAAVAPLVFVACFDLTGVGEMFGGRLIAIDLWSNGSTVGIVEVGDTVRVSTLGRVNGAVGMFVYDRVLDAAWRSSDPTVARVERLPPPPRTDSTTPGETLVRGLMPGTTRVTATARGIVGEMSVRVIPPVDHIDLRPPRDTILVGDTIQIAVAAVDPQGNPIENVPLGFETDSLLARHGWDTNRVGVVALDTGRATVFARFRRATGRLDLVVAPRIPND